MSEPKFKDGWWWATRKGARAEGIHAIRVSDNCWVDQVGSFDRTLIDMWEVLEKIVMPQVCRDFNGLKDKAKDMQEAFPGRHGVWENWIERNQDVLEVGRGFIYRLGFECFILESHRKRVVPHYQRMASDNHAERGSTGPLIPFPEWDVGLIDTWEKMFPRMFPIMERVIRDRWFRRDGIWDGSEARYQTDITIFKGLGGK